MPTLAATDQSGFTVLPEDVYKAKIVNLTPKQITWDGETKDVLEFTFEVMDDTDYEGVQVNAIATLYGKLTPKSKLRLWAEAILNRKLTEGEQFDTDTLMNKTCRISTTTEEGKKGGTFTKIKDVMPARAARPAAAKAGDAEGERF